MAQLTEKQVMQMQARGMDLPTIENLAKQKGYSMPQRQDLLQKTTNIVNKFIPGGKLGEALGTQGGLAFTKIKDKIQGTNNAQYYDRSQPNNFQIAGDVAQAGVTAYGSGLKLAGSIAGKAAQFGKLGATSGFSSGIAEGKNIAESAGQGIREGVTGALLGGTFGVVEKAIKGTGAGVGKLGDKIQTTVIKPSQADIKDGFSLETIKRYNLGGSLKDTLQKTDARLDNLSKELNAKLGKSNSSVNLNTIFENTAKRLLGNKFQSFGSNSKLGGSLEQLREEILGVSGNGFVSVPEAQIVKRAAGHYGAWTYGAPTPEASANQQVYNTFYNELKRGIEEASPEGVRQINKQISELIPIMNAVIRRIPVAERNSALSLTDIITLTGAALNPTALALPVLNIASKSGRVGQFLGKGTQAGEAAANAVRGIEKTAQTLFPSTR